MRIILFLLLASIPTYATQAWVQNGPNTCHAASGNIACTMTGVTSGNHIYIALDYRLNAATDVTSVVGSGTGTLGTISLANSVTYLTSSPEGSWLYCAPINASGDATVTVTLNGSYFFGHVMLQEYSGSSCTLAGTSSNTWNGSVQANYTCGTFTPSVARSLVIATVYANENSGGLAAGSGWTTNALLDNVAPGTYRVSGMEYKILASAASQSPNWVDSNSTSFTCVAAAFADPVQPGGKIMHRSSIQ